MALQAVLFDMDGVVTDTAAGHAAAWRRLFDAFLQAREARPGEDLRPFDPRHDYLAHVDGRPRLDGIRTFLKARGIGLVEGGPDDPAGLSSVHALGRLKNSYFQDWLRDHEVRAFPGSVALLRELRARSIGTGLFTSSRNAGLVLASAGIGQLFDVVVDGRVLAEQGLPGKPDPAIILESARRLGVRPQAAAVIEDATAGVAAGRRGGFRLVIGVDRGDNRTALLEHGADLVVDDLANLALDREDELTVKRLDELPLAFDDEAALKRRLQGRRLAVFLDYDGTLTPIVDDPARALITGEMRTAVARLAELVPVAIVSGRDVSVVRRMMQLDELIYAGSHGFEISGPDGFRATIEKGADAVPELERAEAELGDALAGIEGHEIERKRFSIAIHFRRGGEADRVRLEAAVDEITRRHPSLRKGAGKKVLRLQPDIDWDKGHAVLHLLEKLDLGGEDVLPVYIGDDVTDEDAFRALAGRGLAVAVRGESDRETAANLALRGQDEVHRLLERLAQHAARFSGDPPTGSPGRNGDKYALP